MTKKNTLKIPFQKQLVCERRRTLVMKGAQVLTFGIFFSSNSQLLAAKREHDPRKQPVNVGDYLCLPSWEEDGRLLHPEDLIVNHPPLLVYPCDPESKVIKERSRLNQILIARLDENSFDKATAENSADGVVAYSGLCTHTACAVSEWNENSSNLVCPCHGSEFDPSQSGTRITGPAPRALPALPIELVNNSYVVRNSFTSKVGSSV